MRRTAWAQVAETLRDYADQAGREEINARILNLLGNDIRAVLLDEDLAAGLDGFDLSTLRGFLSEHDAFLADYYPRVFLGVRQEVKADPVTLQRELLPRLAEAEKAIRAAEILDPSVGDAMALVRHQALGAQRVMMTAHDPERVAAAEQVLARDAVLATGLLGRIVARVLPFAEKEKAKWQADILGGVSRAKTVYDVANILIQHLGPIFRFLWTLITKGPPPF